MMKKELVSLPDAEFEVMDALWKCGGKSISTVAIQKQMNTDKKAQTVLTMLSRLSEKGFLSSEKLGKERTWTAKVTEEEYRSFEAKKIVDRVYGGSLSELISAFYDGKGLTREEADSLLDFIEKQRGGEGK